MDNETDATTSSSSGSSDDGGESSNSGTSQPQDLNPAVPHVLSQPSSSSAMQVEPENNVPVPYEGFKKRRSPSGPRPVQFLRGASDDQPSPSSSPDGTSVPAESSREGAPRRRTNAEDRQILASFAEPSGRSFDRRCLPPCTYVLFSSSTLVCSIKRCRWTIDWPVLIGGSIWRVAWHT
jgi:hypothetical protein